MQLTAAYIEIKEGTAVADQFRDSFENQNFDDQNYNALIAIRRQINSILKIGELNKYEIVHLEDYLHYLDEHLNK